MKEDITPVENALAQIVRLRGVKYRWKHITRQVKNPDGTEKTIQQEPMETGFNYGLIAQEVEQIFPEAVYTDREGYKSIAYDQLISPLIEAVKTLREKNGIIESENMRLKTEVSEIAAENERLKSIVTQMAGRMDAIEKQLAETEEK